MYSTCLFCHANLGANEVVEHFPIGRRLAFDGAKGRLWVVCRSCERWNLTPLEERWEAIEECERLFRGTTLRMSTEHIGLARVSEGLQLVRVGEPQRPEMAAWRYGDQFGKRRKKYWAYGAGGSVVIGALVLGNLEFGLFAGGAVNMLNFVNVGGQAWWKRRIAARPPIPGGRAEVPRGLLHKVKIVSSRQYGTVLQFERKPETRSRRRSALGAFGPRDLFRTPPGVRVEIPFDRAGPTLAALLPAINFRGGSPSTVSAAVQLMEKACDTQTLLHTVAMAADKANTFALRQNTIIGLPRELRFALEMALHEDDERRALEGELAQLEERWKEAEEIASISDNMFLPSSVTDWLSRVRA